MVSVPVGEVPDWHLQLCWRQLNWHWHLYLCYHYSYSQGSIPGDLGSRSEMSGFSWGSADTQHMVVQPARLGQIKSLHTIIC